MTVRFETGGLNTVKSVLVWLSGIVAAGLIVVVGADAFGYSVFPWRHATQDRPAVLKSIQDISEYHAAVGNFEVVLDLEENVLEELEWIPVVGNAIEALPDVVDGRRTLFVATGTVDAYVDFSGMNDDDLKLSEDGTSVEIWLPEAELDKPNLDSELSYVFTQERGLLARIADALETPEHAKYYQLAEAKLADAAEVSELRQRARENTEAMLSVMFSSLGITATFHDDGESR